MSGPVLGAPSWRADSERDVPGHDDWLAPPEAVRLAAMTYTKRWLESRLGRWTAKRAIAHVLGLPGSADALRTVRIVNAPDGAPEAFVDDGPAGVSISMTDRAGWAVCVVSPTGTAVGCDLEVVEPRSAAFVTDYFTRTEQELVSAWPDRDVAANLIWSAKESALKVLRTGLRRDTRSVVVAPEGDGAEWCGWAAEVDGALPMSGWWRRYDRFVLTVAAQTPLDPPRSQVEPSPLVTAAPIHSWLERPLTGVSSVGARAQPRPGSGELEEGRRPVEAGAEAGEQDPVTGADPAVPPRLP